MTVHDLTTSPHTPAALRRAALRFRSPEALGLLAAPALGMRSAQGREALDHLRASRRFPADLAWEWAVPLAHVLALQPAADGDHDLARRLFDRSPPRSINRAAWPTYAALLAADGDQESLRRLLRRRGHLVPDADALEANLLNPALPGTHGEESTWAVRVAEVLAARGMPGTTVAAGSGSPFDRLHATGQARSVDGPLITVVMTTYRPGTNLLTSLRSVTAQTWTNLQIVLVDDASGPDHAAVLAEAAGMDDRVELVRLERNRGTYGARNAALERARGEFVTGHDDDDWAHPRRVEQQVAPLLADPEPVATLSRAVWASEELEMAPLGWPAVGNYAPSYLVRREALDRAGRYLPARKAADTEMVMRVRAATGSEPLVVPEALTVYRTRAGSLSRADYLPGWDHPARVAFRGLCAEVHDRISGGRVDPRQAPEHIAVPHRFQVDPGDRDPLDVLIAADWRIAPGRGPGGFVAELEALADAGLRVGVVQADDIRAAGALRGVAHTRMRRLINDGVVELVTFDDPVHARLALVRAAGALMYAPPDVTVTVDRVVVVADQTPGSDLADVTSVDLHHCDAAVTETFGQPPLWIAEDAWLHARLTTAASGTPLADRVGTAPYRGTAPRELFRVSRPRQLLGTPVLGAVVSGRRDLPDDEADIARVLTRRFDVRVLAPSTAVAEWGDSHWLPFPPDATDPTDYYAQVDIVVRFPHHTEGVGLDVAHALAAGCVVVLPERFRGALGDAAVYATPAQVAGRVDALLADPQAYRAQVTHARRYAQQFLTRTAYSRHMRGIARIGEESRSRTA